ncbi:hypothetical protein COU50_04295, partial [bacterium CG10_big_fil_rev_8_21_14_0_10_33_18]
TSGIQQYLLFKLTPSTTPGYGTKLYPKTGFLNQDLLAPILINGPSGLKQYLIAGLLPSIQIDSGIRLYLKTGLIPTTRTP